MTDRGIERQRQRADLARRAQPQIDPEHIALGIDPPERLDHRARHALRRRAPDAEPTGFSAIALGKHGARELNYSSDIDPILLFDPATLPRRDRDEPGTAAQRVARAVIETLSRVDAEGYVFRVDLRLRPASEVSPLAMSPDAARARM